MSTSLPSSAPAAPSAVTHLWRAIRESPPPLGTWPSALRRGLLPGIFVALGAATGNLGLGSYAAMGSLGVAFVEATLPRRQSMRLLVAVMAALVAPAFVGTLIGGSWIAVAFLAAIALAYGTISAVGPIALNAGMTSLMVSQIFAGNPGDLHAASSAAAAMLIGGTVQIISSAIAWRYERDASVRRALTIAVLAVRRQAQEDGIEVDAQRRSGIVCANTARLISGAGLEPARRDTIQLIISDLEKLRFRLSAWMAADAPAPHARTACADQLSALAAALERTRSRSVRALPGPVSPAGSPGWSLVAAGLNALRADIIRLRSEDEAGDAGIERDDAAGTSGTEPMQVRAAALAGLFSWSNPTFRYALRLALAIAIASSVARIFELNHGYWIGIAVATIVKPDFASTVTRGALRIAGTFAAVLLVGTLLETTGNPQWLMALLVLLLAPILIRLLTANYALASFATAAVILTLSEAAFPSGATIGARLINTCIGAAIGIGMFVIWPLWHGKTLPRTLADLIASQRAWVENVLVGLADSRSFDSVQTRALAVASRDAAVIAAASAQSAIVEPHSPPMNLSASLAMLDACDRIGNSTSALEFRAQQNAGHPEINASRPYTVTTASQILADLDEALRQVLPFAADLSADDSPGVSSPRSEADRSTPASSRDERIPVQQPDDRALAMLLAAAASLAEAGTHLRD